MTPTTAWQHRGLEIHADDQGIVHLHFGETRVELPWEHAKELALRLLATVRTWEESYQHGEQKPSALP